MIEPQLMISKTLKNFDFGQMKLQKLMSDAAIVTQNYMVILAVGRGIVMKTQNHVNVIPASLETNVR